MKTKTCPDCNGDGVIDKDTDDERQCPTCGGVGVVSDDGDSHEEVIKTDEEFAADGYSTSSASARDAP
jgi:DnaJ-class molecular chaperone